MEQIKHVEPRAGAFKHDLLTSLSVAGLHGHPTTQTSLMRLTALITARYNWRVEEVNIGHAELGGLWSVNDGTVKREMKRLPEMGVLTCVRPGVRGRVGAYRLNYRQIYEMSQPVLAAVGPDFEDRMMEVSGARTVVRVDFQTPAPQVMPKPALPPQTLAGVWGAVRRRLKAEHPAIFDSWFAKLVQEACSDHALTLRAPNGIFSRYIETHFAVKLAAAVDAEMPTPDGAPRQISLISTQP